MTVKPLKSSDSAVTSSTAKQILDVLERMNTPLNVSKINTAVILVRFFKVILRYKVNNFTIIPCFQDAKKIPSYASNVVDSPLTFSVSLHNSLMIRSLYHGTRHETCYSVCG